ncbi:hypothetical protein [Parasphingorhabdus sp.]|uniref:hypothetical protein n=1 Tax=Parasphingorhabdus sp. TaxID=2709688 RepID=UPI003D2951D8
MESAVARGVKLGPKFKLDELDILEAHRGIYQYNHSLLDMAARYEVSAMTLRRGFERLGLVA